MFPETTPVDETAAALSTGATSSTLAALPSSVVDDRTVNEVDRSVDGANAVADPRATDNTSDENFMIYTLLRCNLGSAEIMI